MWKKSKPNDYDSFRTFIFGITKQSMFPHGVVYEGVSEEPMSFRGESGANDSMASPLNPPNKYPAVLKQRELDPTMRQPTRDQHARNTPHRDPAGFPLLPPR